MPVSAPERPATALFRALRDAHVDPDLAHEASEEVRAQAGQSVIAVVDSRFDVVDSRFDVVDSRFAVMEARFAEVKAEIQALSSRIDVLQRVIWALIGLLATTVFGLLYQVVAKT